MKNEDKTSPHGSFLIQNNDRLQSIIVRILEQDIGRSLKIDSRIENTWMWWHRTDLITKNNEIILIEIVDRISKI